MNAKRGYVPDDEKNFSPEAVQKMRIASRQVFFLLNEGYDLKSASTFVGNHFLFSERQRLAITRSLATDKQLEQRKDRQKVSESFSRQEVWIDGFNTVITAEVMLSDSLLFLGMDGCIRDLAALRGTYRIIPETAEVVRMIFGTLQTMKIQKANILLDEPVSNSGRLKALIAEIGEEFAFEIDIQVLKDVDRTLYEKENVISSDSIILDHCKSWINLMGECLKQTGKTVLKVW
ncbi:MAG: DUF434 domain-containing protein [Lachnospiraceae bacterium]|nr:DUF434 domain-containing protein [Lachnospiraceae bacterium]